MELGNQQEVLEEKEEKAVSYTHLSSTILGQLENSWEAKTLCQVPKAYLLDGQEINRYIHFDAVGLNAQSEIKVSFYVHEIGVTIELVLVFAKAVTYKAASYDSPVMWWSTSEAV